MITPLQKKLIAIVLCISVLFIPRHAKAQGISGGQATAIFVGIIAVGAGLGVGVYLILHRPPSITGCAVTNGNGLTLAAEGDQQTYALSGDLTGIKPGTSVHVSGKKKKDPSGAHLFIVNKVGKTYGPCEAAQTSPPAHTTASGPGSPVPSEVADNSAALVRKESLATPLR